MTPSEEAAFISRIADAVADRLAIRPRLVNRNQLALALGVSVPTIERLQRNGRIAPIRIGKRCCYDIEAAVRALSESAEQTAEAQLSQTAN